MRPMAKSDTGLWATQPDMFEVPSIKRNHSWIRDIEYAWNKRCTRCGVSLYVATMDKKGCRVAWAFKTDPLVVDGNIEGEQMTGAWA